VALRVHRSASNPEASMITWMVLLVTAALVGTVFGAGALVSAFQVVIAVFAVLAVIAWATAGSRDPRSYQRSSVKPRRVPT
jgi:hypothetical protein